MFNIISDITRNAFSKRKVLHFKIFKHPKIENEKDSFCVNNIESWEMNLVADLFYKQELHKEKWIVNITILKNKNKISIWDRKETLLWLIWSYITNIDYDETSFYDDWNSEDEEDSRFNYIIFAEWNQLTVWGDKLHLTKDDLGKHMYIEIFYN